MSTPDRTSLTRAQKIVLGIAFVPMVATGAAGGVGTYSNISHAYGSGTALGAVAAGEGATAVLALVLLGLTMLGQSSPWPVRIGLWALPAAASAMAAMAAPDAGRTVIYAVTPMGMCASAEGMAFLARRIVVHTDGRDAEAEARAAALVRELAYHRAVAANHPDEKARGKSERTSWKLARRIGHGDHALGARLLDVQRDRVTAGADAALGAMFTATTPVEANADESTETTVKRSMTGLPESGPTPAAVNPTRIPAAVQVGFLKPMIPPKPVPSTLLAPIGQAVPAQSARPRRATGRVPQSARSTQPRRTPDQLLTQARALVANWSDAELTAEGIRRALHTSPANARTLRETLRAERAATASQTVT